jgi:hypothetical protein
MIDDDLPTPSFTVLFESKDSIRGLPKQQNTKQNKKTAHQRQVERSQTIVQTWIKIM